MTRTYSSATAHEAHHYNRNLLHHLNHSEQRYPTPISEPSHVDNRTGTSSTSTTEDVEGNNEGRDCDAESDNKEADDEHEDDIAPSDSAIILGTSQAGHTTAERTGFLNSAGQKRKRSVSLEGENSTTAGREDAKRYEKSERAEEVSDADDYAGVDLISDSEEVECAMEQLEESHIIASEEDRLDRFSPTLDLFPEDWHTNSRNTCDIDDDLFHPDETPYFDEEYYRTDSNTLSNISDLDYPPVNIRDQSFPPLIHDRRRRVRFADSQSLAKNLSVDDGLESPRYEQSRLYYREKHQTSNPPRGNFPQDVSDVSKFPRKTGLGSKIGPKKRQDGRIGTGTLDQSFEGSYGSSSGYDSDHGQTTEEEEISSHRTQLLLRRASQSSLRHNKRSQVPQTLPRSSQAGQREGPLMGTWIPASTKPSVVMNTECTSLMVFRFPKKARTKQKTSYGVATCFSPVNTGFSVSYPSFSSDTGGSMPYGGLGCSDKSSLAYAARFARAKESVAITPLLLVKHSGIPTHKYHRIDEDILSPATHFSQSELSYKEKFSPTEDSGENQDELLDLDSFIDYSDDAEESSDDQEHVTATTRDSLLPPNSYAQNEPIEAQPRLNSPNRFPWGTWAGLNDDENDQGTRIPFHPEGNSLDTSDSAVDHSLCATNSASLSPDMRPSKIRRVTDGLSHEQSVIAARAALSVMS